jgi:phosphate uptake regulator
MALREKNRPLADLIEPRDRDVDRLNWLIARQFNLLMENMTLSTKMNINHNEATYLFLLSRLLERIGDHAVKISKEVILIFDEKIDPQIIEMINFASGNSLEILEDTITAWEKKDVKAANKNVDSVIDLASYCKEINDAASSLNGVSYRVSYIAESIRRSGEYAGDISELLIDYLVNE